MTLAKLLGHKSGRFLTRRVANLGEDNRPWLHSADMAKRLKRRHRFQPLVLFILGFLGTHPGLKPSFTSKLESIRLIRAGAVPQWLVEVDREEIADRCAVILAVGKRIRSAKHEQTPSADAHEIAQSAS